jgi:hypothetical protein
MEAKSPEKPKTQNAANRALSVAGEKYDAAVLLRSAPPSDCHLIDDKTTKLKKSKVIIK